MIVFTPDGELVLSDSVNDAYVVGLVYEDRLQAIGPDADWPGGSEAIRLPLPGEAKRGSFGANEEPDVLGESQHFDGIAIPENRERIA